MRGVLPEVIKTELRSEGNINTIAPQPIKYMADIKMIAESLFFKKVKCILFLLWHMNKDALVLFKFAEQK